MSNDESILNTIKKIIGLAEDYNVFDLDIITYINSTFFTLNQLGVGPSKVYSIIDENDTWSDFFAESGDQLETVKTYIALKVKILFDPPTSSYVLDSFNRILQEMEWRFTVTEEVKTDADNGDNNVTVASVSDDGLHSDSVRLHGSRFEQS